MSDLSSDPRIPPRDRCVLRYLLERLAAETPDKVFVQFDSGEAWTYEELRLRLVDRAIALQGLGVRQGEHVVSWFPNGPEALLMFLGLNYIGAVYVPINISYRGGLLAHVVENSDAKLIVAHSDLVPRLAEVDLALLETCVCVGAPVEPIPGLTLLDAGALDPAGRELQPLEREIEPWDTQGVLYTSGTTGPSKGVLCSYFHHYSMFGPQTWDYITPDDRYMINLPLFHMGGTGLLYCMLVHHASVSMVESFNTDTFWDAIRSTGTTAVFLLGVMANFVEARPPAADDRDHPLRLVHMVPIVDDIHRFSERFGLDVYTVYNMTEISTPIHSGPNPTVSGTCGRMRQGVDVRLMDENDCEVPVGKVGEFCVRTDAPWAMNHGYYKNPEATARAWRNGWFHTGDAGMRDAEGNYFFVDRIKDAIRRRGENISSLEVEIEITAHQAIQEAAVIPVPSELAEDEVMAIVSLAPGATLDPAELLSFLQPRMAHFMIPRYVRIVEELPKTPTAKVQKHLLKDEGVTDDTWDREAAGIRIKRERLGN